MTGNTTAKITFQHGVIYDRLIQKFGEEKALQYVNANKKAIDKYFRIVTEEGIDCMLEE